MINLAYTSGRPILNGDLVKRGKGTATYRVDGLYMAGNHPVVILAPVSGYTSASAFGMADIERLQLIEPKNGEFDE